MTISELRGKINEAELLIFAALKSLEDAGMEIESVDVTSKIDVTRYDSPREATKLQAVKITAKIS